MANKTIETVEKSYTTYEQTADREYTGQADTRTESEWFLYYLQYVDREEYPDFVTWLADMLKTGKKKKRRKNNTMKKKIVYLTITAVIGVTAFFVGKFTAQPTQPETVQAQETEQTEPAAETEKTFDLLEMTVENGGLYLEYTDGNNFYSHWIPSENLADHDLINVNDIKGWETYKTDDLVGIELQASDWGYVIEKEAYTVDTTVDRTE